MVGMRFFSLDYGKTLCENPMWDLYITRNQRLILNFAAIVWQKYVYTLV